MRELLQPLCDAWREWRQEMRFGRSFGIGLWVARHLRKDLVSAEESFAFVETNLQDLICELSHEAGLDPQAVIQRRWKKLDAEELLKSIQALRGLVIELYEKVPQI